MTMLAAQSQNPTDMLHYNMERGKVLKRKEGAARALDREAKRGKGTKCNVLQKFTMPELTKRGMKELQEEAKAHSLPHYGTVKDLAERVEAHYTSFIH